MEKTIKILIADENAAQRQSLQNELCRAGYANIEQASNGEDALTKIHRLHLIFSIRWEWVSAWLCQQSSWITA
ncbi:MAG: hypothetical protein IKJ00_07020 [Clostridia bacterium]|nr:hypothetical protein [Clostridia bacterium]